MSEVDEILEFLENGEWHDLKEIEQKMKLYGFDISSITKFLAQYKFIKLDKGGKKAKLDPSTKHFLKKIQKIEGEEKL